MNPYERVMIFIDGSNIFRSIGNLHEKGIDFKIDYVKLRDLLAEGRDLIRTYYYGSDNASPNDAQKGFLNVLRNNGFEVFTKTLKTFKGEDGKDHHVEKGIDIALATDLISLAWEKAFDTAIVVSGDSDFLEAIRRVKQKGRRVEIAAFEGSLSAEMRVAGDRITILDKVLQKITLTQPLPDFD